MSMRKRVMSVVLLFILIFSVLLGRTTIMLAAEEFEVEASSAFAIDVESGKVLFDQDGEKVAGIASITKLLSAYIVLDQVKQGKLEWDDKVAISPYVEELSLLSELSNVPLTSDYDYTVKELFEASLIVSANATTVALAEKIAGDEVTFVNMMRAQLKKWSIQDADIYNASGLSNVFIEEGQRHPGSGKDDENLMSARDVSIIARHLILDFPEVLTVTATPSGTFGSHTDSPISMTNWNTMLSEAIDFKEGVNGLKTGTTDLAGACFVGSIERDGRQIITVVLDATNESENASARFIETGRLMDYCLENWVQVDVGKKGEKLTDLTQINVKDGKVKTVPVALKESLKLWAKKEDKTLSFETKTSLDKKLVPKEGLQAPATKGTEVGTATINLKQDSLGYLSSLDQPKATIIITKEVKKSIWLKVLLIVLLLLVFVGSTIKVKKNN